MIDTIVLRIHNMSKYRLLYEQYYNPTKEKNTVTKAFVSEDTGEYMEVDYSAALVFHDNNRVLPLVHRSTKHVPSSHYTVSYAINTQADFIEFNFSIPKYLWATNIFQFVNLHDQSEILLYSQLRKFIDEFISDNLPERPLYDDIEVNRVDMCYNQFFLSKADALAYLGEQNKLLVKYARSSKNKFRAYDTSVMYVTRRYSFKIYHKGTEFAKGDYKRLCEYNPKGYDLQYLQDSADCQLRYEMSFRASFFDYVVKQYYYSSEVKAGDLKYSGHPVAKAYYNMASFGGQKLGEKFFSVAKRYMLKSPWDYPQLDFDVKHESRSMTFDLQLFQILVKTFWDKVKQYQINRQLDIVEIDRRITQHIEKTAMKKRARLPTDKAKEQGRLRLLSVALLSHYMNIESLKNYVPRSSFYRMKADLKLLGLDTITHGLSIPQPKLDYSDYKIYLSKYH